jgi:hypothetical protein
VLKDYNQTCVQQPPSGLEKSGSYAESEKDQVRFRLVIVASGWSMLTSGRCLEDRFECNA